jgi:hypothetical protein
VYRLLAFAQFRQNETYEALATCEKGIVIYPDSKPLTEFYVSVLHKAVSGEDLHSRLEIAIQWAPDSPAVAKALGEDLLTANSTRVPCNSFPMPLSCLHGMLRPTSSLANRHASVKQTMSVSENFVALMNWILTTSRRTCNFSL